MKKIPNAREVTQTLKAAQGAVKQSLKELNQTAGQMMAKGDYAGAQALAEKGREIQQFHYEVDALRQRWRELRSDGGDGGNSKKTPLWSYYHPVLKALTSAGGEARVPDIEPEVERLLADSFQPGDREEMSNGRQRWRAMVRRTRKHLVAEGWIQDETGPVWRITESGRRIAAKPLAQFKDTAK